MDCLAHRGFAETNPENTLPAIRAASHSGADAIEVDVRRCGSGEVVVVHDETVDRVSDGSGPVAEHSLSALQDLDVLDTGEGFPTLASAFEAAGDVRLNVELKEVEVAADALTVADEHGRAPLFSSFDPEALERVGEAGDAATALLFASDPGRSLERARSLGCAAVHPQAALCEESFVARAHDAGLAVNAWTVRSGATADRLAAAGVDGLIADAPAYCRDER